MIPGSLGLAGARMRRRFVASIAAVAVSAACGFAVRCSGEPWYELEEGRFLGEANPLPGVLAAVDHDVYRYDDGILEDIDKIFQRCTVQLVLEAEQEELDVDDILNFCHHEVVGLDTEALVQGDDDPDRLARLARVVQLALLDPLELEEPVPDEILRRGILSGQFELLTWLIPVFEDALRNEWLDWPGGAELRAVIMDQVRRLVRSQSCTYGSNVTVNLDALRLENLRSRWLHVDGKPGLEMLFDIDEDRRTAQADIATFVSCAGSTNNLANSLLELALPDGSYDVHLEDATLSLRFAFEARDGAAVPRVTPSVSIGGVAVEKVHDWISDEDWSNLLADNGLSAETVEEQANDSVGGLAEAIGPTAGEILTRSLPPVPDEASIYGVRLDTVEAEEHLLIGTRKKGWECAARRGLARRLCEMGLPVFDRSDLLNANARHP